MVANLSSKIIDNPEIEEIRCRICYEESKPLITLCECSGTIGFVHEDCILDWITKKMETAETVEIPRCEICRTKYSARLKIGQKRICYKTLGRRIRELNKLEIFTSLFFLVGTIIAVYLGLKMVLFLVFSFFKALASIQETISNFQLGALAGLITDIFTMIVFPSFFVTAACENGKKRLKLWDDSMVQIV